MRMLLKDIKGLVGTYDETPPFLAGLDMNEFPVLESAWLAVEDGRVIDFGSMADFPGITDWTGLEVVDCTGRYVLPAWCDSHTHLVYAADRSGEFLDRLNGLSYHEIAARGGGILNSARALQVMDEAQLLDDARLRIQDAMRQGTGAIEIKSGYGLTAEAELKMLRVIAELKRDSPIPIRSTFLACHAVPDGFDSAMAWTDHVIKEILPVVAEQGLADYIDAFLEKGYFGTKEVEKLLSSAQKMMPSTRPKIHVNQFNILGGVALCVAHGARSVDHLEELCDDDIMALQSTLKPETNVTFPVALPGCSHFLNIPYTPGRRMIDAGLPLALATDHNPGSAPSGNMTLAVQLAMVKMKLRPLEAICAATLNGAAAMDLSGEVGALSRGYRANLLVTEPLSDLAQLGYRFGDDPISQVVINGVRQRRAGH